MQKYMMKRKPQACFFYYVQIEKLMKYTHIFRQLCHTPTGKMWSIQSHQLW